MVWLCIYRPPPQMNEYSLDSTSKSIIPYHYSDGYDNHIVVGDFDLDESHRLLSGFMDSHYYLVW